MTPSPSSPLHRVSTYRTHSASSPTRQSAIPSTVAANTFSSPLDSFADDPTLSPFLSSSFSSTTFSSAALSSGSPASIAEHLHRAIHLLESQIRNEVLSRHTELLDQLSSLRDAEHALSAIRSSVSSLQSSVLRVRYQVSEPQKLIRLKTIQLSNLNRTIETLQHAIRTLRLSRKLRDLVHQWETESEKADLGKAAHMYCEILSSCDEFQLQGIVVVDEEVSWVMETGEKLRNAAIGVLEKGMESLNQTEVGTGLQIFHNLGELRRVVEQFVSKYKLIAARSISAALDWKAISGSAVGGFGPGGIKGGGGTPQIGGGVKAREGVWQRMQSCMDQLQRVVVAVWHLQRVLSKKKDPFTHVLLLDEAINEGEAMLTDQVWEAMVNAFATHMKSAFTASSFVKEIFTNGYPKLFFMVESLVERISHDTDVKGTQPAIRVNQRDEMAAAIAVFQTAFLASCLSRLSDLVNSAFSVSSRVTVPSKEQISRILSRIQEEIEAVQLDGRLTRLVLHEISKVLLLLAERAEYQISTGHEVRQVSSSATAAQLKNFALHQLLQETHTRVSSSIVRLPPTVADALSPSLGAIYGVARDSVAPLFTAMINQLENSILQIHHQNFGPVHGVDSPGDSGASSPYMEELQRQILHFRTEFLSRLFPPSSTMASVAETICMQPVKSLAARVLVFFVRHASLIRPLADSGKLRMVRDMAELELTVSQNLYPVEQLGPPYQALRAFRPLIFLDTSQLPTSPLLHQLPPSVTLHHLYSRAPDELQSPLQRNVLTPLQYSLWLDSQGEEQVWKGVKATLDDYCARVKSRGDREFSPLYPLMLQLGSSLVENADAVKNM